MNSTTSLTHFIIGRKDGALDMGNSSGTGIQGFFRSSWGIENAFVGACAFWVLAYWVSFLTLGPGASSDLITILWATSFAVTTAGVCYVLKGSRLSPLGITFGVTVLVHALPRIWEYIAVTKFSRKEMFVLFPLSWLPEVTNRGLAYATFGNLMLALGFYLAKRFMEPKLQPIWQRGLDIGGDSVIRKPWIVAITFFIVAAVDTFYTMYVGLSAASNCAPNVRFKWIIHFFSLDIAAFAVIFLLVNYGERLGKMALRAFVVLIAIYLIYTVGLGSRSGILRVALVFMFVAMGFAPTIRLQIRRLMGPLLVAGIVAFVAFALATHIRELRFIDCEAGLAQASNEVAVPPAPSSPQTSAALTDEKSSVPVPAPTPYSSYIASWLTKESALDANKIQLPPMIARGLDRVGVFDYAVAFPSLKLDPEVQEKYFTFRYGFEALVNNLVPGTIYPDSDIMTARLHPMLFRERTLEHTTTNYLSEVFAIWGIGFVYFGYWGGLLTCLAAGVLLSACWLMLAPVTKSESGPARGMIASLFLWALVYSGVYLSQGVDYAIVVLIYAMIQLLTFILIVRVLSMVDELIRRKVK